MSESIVICGSGIVGSSTAYYLTRHQSFNSSISITLLDASGIASGASGKAGGFLASDWHSPDTATLTKLSWKLHKDLAEQHNGAEKWGYRALTTLQLSTSATRSPKSRKRKIGEIPPWVPLESVRTASVLGNDKTTAQVHPEQLTKALAQLAQDSGVQYRKARAVGVELQDGKPCALQIEQDGHNHTIPCTTLILAAGPWTGSLASQLLGPDLAKPVAITGSRAHSIVLKPSNVEEDFGALTPHALFTHMTLADGSVAEPEVYPRPDKTAYICGESDSVPLPDLASEVHPSSTSIAALKTQASALSPLFKNAQVVAEQACYLPYSATGSPLLGPLPRTQNIFIASGNSCWGILNGPAMGYCTAQLVMDGKTEIDVDCLAL